MADTGLRATAAVAIVALFLLAACDDGDAPVSVSVRAEFAGDEPVAVEATDVRDAEGGLLHHSVRVEWHGNEPVQLDDARFTHDVQTGSGHLVTVGRGCGADWDDTSREVQHVCTADLRIIELQPGESHEYSVSVLPRVGPLRLSRGTYVVEESIAWWRQGDRGNPAGRFTVRLTYDVR